MKTYDIKAVTYPGSDSAVDHNFVASDCRPTGILMEDGNSGISTIPVIADGKLALWLSVALQDVENSRQFTFKLDNGERTCFQSEGGVWSCPRFTGHSGGCGLSCNEFAGRAHFQP